MECVPPYSPNLNRATERLNLDSEQKIRSLILDSGFPKELWANALKLVVDVYDKTPKKALSGEIPYFKFIQRP